MYKFTIGKLYNRQNDLHKKYGGKIMAGISPSAKYPIIFLFVSYYGKAIGYKDGWLSETTYQYSGEGQVGNMEFVRGNLAIREHKAQGRKLHLFKKMDGGLYEYVGEFQYKDHKFVSAPDSNRDERQMILFRLEKVPE